MVYDVRDRIVATQDAKLRQTNEWIITKYDALNRPILTGIETINKSRLELEQDLSSNFISKEKLQEEYIGIAAGGNIHDYTNRSFPSITDEKNCLTVSYFDNYNAKPATAVFNYQVPATSNLTNEAFKGFEITYNNNVVGTASITKVKNLETDEWYTTLSYFDEYGRIIQTIGENHLNGYDRISMKYNFAGEVLATVNEHRTYKDDGSLIANLIVGERFVYRPICQLLET